MNFVRIIAGEKTARKCGSEFRMAMAVTCSEGRMPGRMMRIHELKCRQTLSVSRHLRVASLLARRGASHLRRQMSRVDILPKARVKFCCADLGETGRMFGGCW